MERSAWEINSAFFYVVEEAVHRTDNYERVLGKQMKFSGVCRVFQLVVQVLG